MRVLVFGKTGQVATELARQGGASIICLGRSDADLSDSAACAEVIAKTNTDIIINAAAYTAVDKAEDEEDYATLINGKTVAAMAASAAQRNIPFLHISTDYVFDGTGNQAWAPSDAIAPVNAYGRSKRVGEQGVIAANGVYAILRTSWVVSSHGNNFVKNMLRLGTDRNELSIVNDQIGGPTSAADIALTLLKIAEAFYKGQGKSGIYHYASAPDTNWADFAIEIFKQADLNVSISGIPSKEYPTPAVRPLNSRLNCDSINAVFGIERPNWQVSLGKIIQELEAV